MILFLLITLAFAKIKGYKIQPIFKAYALYPYFLLEFITVFLQIQIFFDNFVFVQYAPYIKTAYLMSLIIPIIVYKLYKPGLIGAGLILAGTLFNKFVMWQNGGKMPVYATFSKLTGYYSESAIATADGIHVIGSDTTRFKVLSDWIDIGYSILSIGDVLIHLFTVIIVYYAIREINLRIID